MSSDLSSDLSAKLSETVTSDSITQLASQLKRLPKEIRQQIWRSLANSEPRVVELAMEPRRRFDPAIEFNPAKSEFYSPTELPSYLRPMLACSESRDIAAQCYPLLFGIPKHCVAVEFNPDIDTLFFPAWCFENNIHDWEVMTPSESKDQIKRVAVELLIRYSDADKDEDGNLNQQIRIGELKNLEELILVSRKADETGCGCCHEFKHPEEGKVDIKQFEEEELVPFFRDIIRDFERVFDTISEKDKQWKRPAIRVVHLLRDGKPV